MPELPEVRTVVKHLKNHLVNQEILNIKIYKEKLIKNIDPQQFINNLINKKIDDVTNYGKFIVFHIENNLILLSHLRMEGKYRIESPTLKIKNHDHIIFQLSSNKWLIYNDSRQFGTFHLKNKNDYLQTNPLNKIAPEPNKIKLEEFVRKMQKKNLAIKSVLLDQTIICGLGNIYANEVLWQVQVNPNLAAKEVTKQSWQKILSAAQQILDKATKWGGSTLNSFVAFGKEIGNFQQFLQVHQRLNQPCSRCHTIILKQKINGRGTYYCPTCQK